MSASKNRKSTAIISPSAKAQTGSSSLKMNAELCAHLHVNTHMHTHTYITVNKGISIVQKIVQNQTTYVKSLEESLVEAYKINLESQDNDQIHSRLAQKHPQSPYFMHVDTKAYSIRGQTVFITE